MSDPTKPERVHDPRVLRAIAHPVRNRILDEPVPPVRCGPPTSPSPSTSRPTRQLPPAPAGQVRPRGRGTGEGSRRPRPGVEAVHESGLNIDTTELAAAPGGKAAVTVFRREWTNAAHEAVERAETAERNPETS